jgi:NAD kinase
MYEKAVVVTRKTRLMELIERYNSRAQAKFAIEHAGGDFSNYELEDKTYRRALAELASSLAGRLKVQMVDRGFVPTFLFAPTDLVITVGQDGLVANTAKYVNGQPIVAVNPDPARFDGILLPFRVDTLPLDRILDGEMRLRQVTLAEAILNDGQRLLAFNDLFIGPKTHTSARYRITFGKRSERQSSSGVIVSTGAGSTGWLSSVYNMIRAFNKGFVACPLAWEDPRLVFVVREPFISRTSGAEVVTGVIESDLVIESLMPGSGVIFSDGIEADFLNFNSGSVARIRAAEQRARLVTA